MPTMGSKPTFNIEAKLEMLSPRQEFTERRPGHGCSAHCALPTGGEGGLM